MAGRNTRWLLGTSAASAALFVFSPTSAQTVVIDTDRTTPVEVLDGESFSNSASIEVDWSDVEFDDLPPVISAVYGHGAVPAFVNQSTGVIRGLGWDHAYGVEILGETGTFQNHGASSDFRTRTVT